jgi:hypothetical protein
VHHVRRLHDRPLQLDHIDAGDPGLEQGGDRVAAAESDHQRAIGPAGREIGDQSQEDRLARIVGRREAEPRLGKPVGLQQPGRGHSGHGHDRTLPLQGEQPGTGLGAQLPPIPGEISRLHPTPGDRVLEADPAVRERQHRDEGHDPGQRAGARPGGRLREPHQDDEGDREVEQQQQIQRRVAADLGNPPETHDQARGDAPRRVDGGGDAHASGHVPGVRRDDAHEDREGRAEQRRRREDDRQHEQVEPVDRIAAPGQVGEARVGEGQIGDGGDAGDDRDTDRHVQQRERPGQVADAIDARRDAGAAQPDPQQIGGQHRREAVERPLHHDAEGLRPDDLVADRHEAGDAEEDVERGGADPSGRDGRRRCVRARGAEHRGCAQRPRGGQHEGRDPEVERAGPEDGAGQPELRDEPEAAQIGAQYGAERVRGIQDRAPATQAAVVAHQAARHHRQRGAHGHRGGQQHERGQTDARRGHALRRRRRVEPGPDSRQRAQQRQREQREGADRELEQRVDAQGPRNAGQGAGRHEVAERHAAEEDGQDGRDRLGRGPEGEAEKTRPDDLIDERREPREDETGHDGGAAHDGRGPSLAWPWGYGIGRARPSRDMGIFGSHGGGLERRATIFVTPGAEIRHPGASAPVRPRRQRRGVCAAEDESAPQVDGRGCRYAESQPRTWHGGC